MKNSYNILKKSVNGKQIGAKESFFYRLKIIDRIGEIQYILNNKPISSGYKKQLELKLVLLQNHHNFLS